VHKVVAYKLSLFPGHEAWRRLSQALENIVTQDAYVAVRKCWC